MADRKEVNTHEEHDFRLERDHTSHVYRTLRCQQCDSDNYFKITLADNGQWGIECDFCQNASVILSTLINTLR